MSLDGGLAGSYDLPALGVSRRRAAAEADAAAFAGFYRDEFPRLAGYCRALVGSEGMARDIAQEALVRVFSRWSGVDRPRPYAYLVATNLARRTWRRRALELRALARTGPLSTQSTREAVADPAESDRPWLRELVEQLPDRHRLPVLLHYYADLPVAEVGRLLRLPAGTVKRRLHEARAALAGRIEERP